MTYRVAGEGVVSFVIYPLFTYSICYREVYKDFLEGVDFLLGGFFTLKIFHREASKGEISRGNFTLGEFARIHFRNSFYLSYFSLPAQYYMWGCSGSGIETVWKFFHGIFFYGRNSPLRNFLQIQLSFRGGDSWENILPERVSGMIEKLSDMK